MKPSKTLDNKWDFFSNNGADHASAMLVSSVYNNPTWATSVGYMLGCIWMTSYTRFTNDAEKNEHYLHPLTCGSDYCIGASWPHVLERST